MQVRKLAQIQLTLLSDANSFDGRTKITEASETYGSFLRGLQFIAHYLS